MDRPGGPARHWLLGLAEGPAWLPQAEAWSHQLGALKAWARDPVELWVACCQKGPVQISAPPWTGGGSPSFSEPVCSAVQCQGEVIAFPVGGMGNKEGRR